MCIATNTYKHYKQCHYDIQNDEIGSYGTVLSISKIDKYSCKVIIFIAEGAFVKVLQELKAQL